MSHSHYEILSLPFTGTPTSPSKQQLKLAYHKALLKHHPDKASSVTSDSALQSQSQSQSQSQQSQHPNTSLSSPRSASAPSYTIDQITTAYKTLSDPQLRAEYDRGLRLDREKAVGHGQGKNGAVFHTGLEVVDLEDLGCDEEGQKVVWYRGCRCGDDRGFLVTEDELEREAEHGEIVVGCRGCSLWMKVLFAVDEGA